MPLKRKAVKSVASPVHTAENGGDSRSGTPSAVKRQRVSRACDHCRSTREKCDGVRPRCAPCVSHRRSCIYSASQKKRGVPTGYLRLLEIALALLFDTFPGSQDSLICLLSQEDGQGRKLLAERRNRVGARLHRRWAQSKVRKEIEVILSDTNSRLERADDMELSSDDDCSVDNSETRIPRRGASTCAPPADDDSRETVPSCGAEWKHHEPLVEGVRGPQLVSAHLWNIRPNSSARRTKLPPNYWRLLDIYFAYTHCWFPILEKQDVLKTSYLYPEEGLELCPTDLSSAGHAEVWSALALASFQNAASSKATKAVATQQSLPSSEEIFETARRLIPPETGPFQVQHARALLLLSLVKMASEEIVAAWILVGFASRIALRLDLGSRPEEEGPHSRAHSALTACFLLDAILSLRLKVPPHIWSRDLGESRRICQDDMDEWQPWVPCEGFGESGQGGLPQSRSPTCCMSVFNQLFELVNILSECSVGRKQPCPDQSHHGLRGNELIQAINTRLTFSSFISSQQPSFPLPLPSSYVLRLVYLWTQSLLRSSAETPLHLALDTLDQYIIQFGACGIPPIFMPFLTIMNEHVAFKMLSDHDKRRWHSFKSAMVAVWTASSHTTGCNGAQSGSSERGNKSCLESQVSPMSLSFESSTEYPATVPPCYCSGPRHLPTMPPQDQVYHSPGSQYALHPHCRPYGPLVVAPVTEHGGTAAGSLDARVLMQTGGIRQPHFHPELPQQYDIQQQRGLASDLALDEDSLLDDLAPFDGVDRINAGPQFMANLGFAPDADLSEILGQEFP